MSAVEKEGFTQLVVLKNLLQDLLDKSKTTPVTPERLTEVQKKYIAFSETFTPKTVKAEDLPSLRKIGDECYDILMQLNMSLGSNRYIPRLF